MAGCTKFPSVVIFFAAARTSKTAALILSGPVGALIPRVDILRVNNENLLTQEDDFIMHKRLAYIAIQLLKVHEKNKTEKEHLYATYQVRPNKPLTVSLITRDY